jgi:hypothetical protein
MFISKCYWEYIIIDIIVNIYIIFCEYMRSCEAKLMKNSNNLFKRCFNASELNFV